MYLAELHDNNQCLSGQKSRHDDHHQWNILNLLNSLKKLKLSQVDNTNPYLNMQYAQGAGEQELVRWREDGSPRKPTQRRQIPRWRGWQKIRRGDHIVQPATPKTLLPLNLEFLDVLLCCFSPAFSFQYFWVGFWFIFFYQALSFIWIGAFRYCATPIIVVMR